jgi:hypothetical protein
MNCAELRESLAEIDDGSRAEQLAHLKTCLQCSDLVSELKLIASAAASLREADDPSPRVWHSIEIALRQEGLIHPQRTDRSLIPWLASGWAWVRWMAPAAALLLFTVGLYIRQHAPSPPLARNDVPPTASLPAASDVAIVGLNDADLLQEIAQQTPAMKASYEDDLRHVNEYIQDAKGIVAANPNDEEARRTLMEAYQEKAMLFELAMDRSLP